MSQEEITYTAVKERNIRIIQERLSRRAVLTDEVVLEEIKYAILSDKDSKSFSASFIKKLHQDIFNRIRRYDVLTELLEDDTITEIMVNGVSEIFIERNGVITKSDIRFESKERLYDIIGRIASGVNRSVNMLSPILDARLIDGSRVNIVLDPVAINGPILTIRKFPEYPIDANELIRKGSVTKEVLEFIKTLVRAKYNILISGGTGSGKTTLLNVMASFISRDERIITIEDSAELQVKNIDNLVRLETRNSTIDGCKEITIRDLIKSALRMRPDRIIVGEVRGEEAIDMLQAFSVGQDGSLSTIHANHADDALYRLETMIMLSSNIPIEALRRQIAGGIDIIVQLGRLRDRSRHILEVREVLGMDGLNIITKPLYEFVEEKEIDGRINGSLRKLNKLSRLEKLQLSGINYEL